MFPSSLVTVLRELSQSMPQGFVDVDDDALVQLLTTIFFAGLETHEGDHNPIKVAFLGKSPFNFIIPQEPESGAVGFYQWQVMPFDSPRPFDVPELVKLAVAGANTQIYSAVHVLADGTLAITGLAREGLNAESDPFIKIIAARPGCLSVRTGRTLLIAYERGAILTGGEHLVFSVGPLRRALEAIAHTAGLEAEDVPDYLNAIQSVVGAMAAHGRGGIIVVSHEEDPEVAESAVYRMLFDSSVASLIRLARHITRTKQQDSGQPSSTRAGIDESGSFGQVLRGAFLTEADRVIERIAALSAIDGAVVLNRDLALMAFGVILPLGKPVAVLEAMDAEGQRSRSIDFGSRGTRHRASANYAAEHPGSVVFVASEDGHVSCLYRDPSWPHVLLWRLGPTHARA